MYCDVPGLKGSQFEVISSVMHLSLKQVLRWCSVRYQCVIQVSMKADEMV